MRVSIIRPLTATGLVALALGGCTSFSLDALRPAAPPVTVQLESNPPGADAVTSIGPGCKTPCSVSIPSTPSFTVTFNAPRYQPVTIPVTVTVVPGDFMTPPSTTLDPNPVVAELALIPPPPRRPAKRMVKRPPKAAAVAAPSASATASASAGVTSPFPAPTPTR